MIKCLKCNTLYSESATVCLYCKIPLEKKMEYDEKDFNFKMREFASETEAQNFKINLLTSEVPCIIKKEGEKYLIMISEHAKKDAFKLKSETFLENSLGGSEKKSTKSTVYIAILMCIVIAFFIFYFTKARQSFLLDGQSSKYKIIEEGGTVDENISERKGSLFPIKEKNNDIKNSKPKKSETLPFEKDKKAESKIPTKEKKPEGKQKVENSLPN